MDDLSAACVMDNCDECTRFTCACVCHYDYDEQDEDDLFWAEPPPDSL